MSEHISAHQNPDTPDPRTKTSPEAQKAGQEKVKAQQNSIKEVREQEGLLQKNEQKNIESLLQECTSWENDDEVLEEPRSPEMQAVYFFHKVLHTESVYKQVTWRETPGVWLGNISPKQALKKIPQYIKKPWAEDIFREIATKDPRTAIELFPLYKETSWGPDVFGQAVLAKPMAAIRMLKSYENSEDFRIPLQYVLKNYSFFEGDASFLDEASDEEIRALALRAQNIQESMVKGFNINQDRPVFLDPALSITRFNTLEKIADTEALFQELNLSEATQNIIRNDIRSSILRYLFLENQPITQDTVRSAIEEIAEGMDRHQETPLFEGRNVRMLSHGEVYNKQRDRFGTQEVKTPLRKAGLSFEHYEPANDTPTEAELQKIKKNTIAAIENTPPPFTFMFDGHGGPNNLFIAKGQIETIAQDSAKENRSLSSQEISNALKKRSEKYKTELESSPDIFILGSCFNHDFLRSVYDQLPKGTARPIFIGASEYNQVSFYRPDLKVNHGNIFNEIIATSKTLGDLMKALQDRRDELSTNPNVYIPKEDQSGAFQITDTQNTPPPLNDLS